VVPFVLNVPFVYTVIVPDEGCDRLVPGMEIEQLRISYGRSGKGRMRATLSFRLGERERNLCCPRYTNSRLLTSEHHHNYKL
jgi:hypothetical protein